MKSITRKSFSIKWLALGATLVFTSMQFITSCDSTTSSTYKLPNRYFKDSVEPIFASNYCVSCHAVGSNGWNETGSDSGGLDLLDGPYDSLVNHKAFEHQFSADSIPRLRVKPGSPDSSYLYMKLTKPDEQQAHGQRMPPGGSIPDSEIAIVKKWIQYGAPLGDTTTH